MTLAVLNTKEAEIELRKSRRAMTKANIDLVDKLIGQGYTADTTAVPTAILQNMTAAPVLATVAKIPAPTIAAGFALPY